VGTGVPAPTATNQTMKIRRQVATGRGRNPKQDKRTQYGNPKASEKYVRNMGPDSCSIRQAS
jgi:hypothetical protein